LRLPGPTGANVRVVQRFAVLHDCRRQKEGNCLTVVMRLADAARIFGAFRLV
jgi:hypothetical protein